MDGGALAGGGRNLAPRPMETVLAGTGGCTAYDVVLILQRGRHDVRRLPASNSAPTRAEADPEVFTRDQHALHRHRQGLYQRHAVERAMAMCARKVLLGQHHAG